jgi:hypothetical protein
LLSTLQESEEGDVEREKRNERKLKKNKTKKKNKIQGKKKKKWMRELCFFVFLSFYDLSNFLFFLASDSRMN